MTELVLEITLTSKSKIMEYNVRIEDVSIPLFTIDGGKTYTNKDIEIESDKDLDIDMYCKIFNRKKWEFTVKDQIRNKIIYEQAGITGENYPDGSSGNPNYSERKASLPIR